ncbi:MAG TPA: hypothetical protein VF221_20930, partial [Chloroflexota bacterium]
MRYPSSGAGPSARGARAQREGLAALIALAEASSATGLISASPHVGTASPEAQPPASAICTNRDNGGSRVRGDRARVRGRGGRHVPGFGHRFRGGRRARHCASSGDQVPLAAREETPGALNDLYFVPRVDFTRSASSLWVILAMLAVTLLAYRHFVYGQETLILLPLWLAGFGMRVVPLVISWFDKPFKVSRADQAY